MSIDTHDIYLWPDADPERVGEALREHMEAENAKLLPEVLALRARVEKLEEQYDEILAEAIGLASENEALRARVKEEL